MLTNDLHGALFSQLRADDALTTMLQNGSGMLDAMPRRRDFPFALLASVESVDRSTDTHDGQAHTLLFEVWSRAANRAQCIAIAERIEGLLVDETWNADGAHIVLATSLGCVTSHDRHSRAFVARLRIRLITEPSG